MQRRQGAAGVERAEAAEAGLAQERQRPEQHSPAQHSPATMVRIKRRILQTMRQPPRSDLAGPAVDERWLKMVEP